MVAVPLATRHLPLRFQHHSKLGFHLLLILIDRLLRRAVSWSDPLNLVQPQC